MKRKLNLSLIAYNDKMNRHTPTNSP